MKIGGIEVSEDVLALNPELKGLVETALEKPSKYHNVKAESRGMVFQSGEEMKQMTKLILCDERRQGVFGLRLQVAFDLPGGNKYVADATGLELLDGILIPRVWDAKGMRTQTYLVKKRAFKAEYGLEITEL